jgi:cholesterol oxidase
VSFDVVVVGSGFGVSSRPLPIALPGASDPAHMTNLFAIGRDNANGRLHLADGRLDAEWHYAGENAAPCRRWTR